MYLKINEKWYIVVNHGVLNKFFLIIGVHLHKYTIMNQFYILGLFILFYFSCLNQLYFF
jgi:hypothetical protein